MESKDKAEAVEYLRSKEEKDKMNKLEKIKRLNRKAMMKIKRRKLLLKQVKEIEARNRLDKRDLLSEEEKLTLKNIKKELSKTTTSSRVTALKPLALGSTEGL